MGKLTARQVVQFLGDRQMVIRDEPLPDLGPRDVLVATMLSAISAGTELHVYRGDVPADLPADETLPALAGLFSYPMTYGYACVGRIVGHGAAVPPDWRGRQVFAFQPHASHFVAPVSEVIPLDLPPSTAVLLPFMETAVNLVLDGRPLLGERVVVVGQGVIGLLTTALLGRYPLGDLVVVEPLAPRRALAADLGARHAVAPAELSDAWWVDRFGEGRADLAFELSGHPAALDTALTATGYAGRVVIGSWYGEEPVRLALGSRFHRSKITVQASQVSHLAPALVGRWSKQRRLSVAAAHLQATPVTRLISHTLPFAEAAAAYHLLDTQPETVMQIVLRYGDAKE